MQSVTQCIEPRIRLTTSSIVRAALLFVFIYFKIFKFSVPWPDGIPWRFPIFRTRRHPATGAPPMLGTGTKPVPEFKRKYPTKFCNSVSMRPDCFRREKPLNPISGQLKRKRATKTAGSFARGTIRIDKGPLVRIPVLGTDTSATDPSPNSGTSRRKKQDKIWKLEKLTPLFCRCFHWFARKIIFKKLLLQYL